MWHSKDGEIYELRYGKFHNVRRRCYYDRKGTAYRDLQFELFFVQGEGRDFPLKGDSCD